MPNPISSISTPPTSMITVSCLVMKSSTRDKVKSPTVANSVSAKAEPRPVSIPAPLPLLKVF